MAGGTYRGREGIRTFLVLLVYFFIFCAYTGERIVHDRSGGGGQNNKAVCVLAAQCYNRTTCFLPLKCFLARVDGESGELAPFWFCTRHEEHAVFLFLPTLVLLGGLHRCGFVFWRESRECCKVALTHTEWEKHGTKAVHVVLQHALRWELLLW